MPGPSNVAYGSVANHFVLSVPIPAGAQLAAGTTERTYTVPGLLVGDIVHVNKPTFQNTLSIGGARVSAANTLAINFVTTGTPTLNAENYLVSVTRHSYPNVSNIPAAIA